MFSVNVDKLIKMTPEEASSFSSTVDVIKQKMGDTCNTLGVVGGGVETFKLASEFMDKGMKVLFVDGNIDTDVFLGKYKLGKDLKGFTGFMNGTAACSQLVCVTNREKLDVIFTGDVIGFSGGMITREKMESFSAAFCSKYDLIVIQSDDAGRVASMCDACVVMTDKSEYSEISSEVTIRELDSMGCLVLGVIINE